MFKEPRGRQDKENRNRNGEKKEKTKKISGRLNENPNTESVNSPTKI